jgi:hypothetical protein
LVRYASQEAAITEAFYVAGVKGWNVAFSCVTRLSENSIKRRVVSRKYWDS